MSDDSDGFSVGDNTEENNQKFGDFEEGELIPPMECQPEPEGDFRPTSESQNNRDYEELPIDDQLECEKSAGMGKSVREPMMKSHGLHGENISHGDCNNGVGPINEAAGMLDGGTHQLDERDFHTKEPGSKEGPTPLIGLGKRPRANRSPPSTGSMQGPPSRSFCQSQHQNSVDGSFDLNRPTLFNQSVCEDVFSGEENQATESPPFGGEVHQQQSVLPQSVIHHSPGPGGWYRFAKV
ncbi:hypothetical protein Hanom_Chr10g00959151 [Helianthus anomalus]